MHRLVPETRGKTLEQIESLFGGGGAALGEVEMELEDAELLEHKRLVSHASRLPNEQRIHPRTWFI